MNNYYEIENKAKRWLKKQLSLGRIVFKKTELNTKIYKFLESNNLLANLYSNYFFLKKEEETAQEAFRQYYWKIVIQFLNLRLSQKHNNPAWYLTGKYAYELLVDNIKIPDADEQVTIAAKVQLNTLTKFFNGHTLIISQDKNFNEKSLMASKIIDEEIYILKPELLIINSNTTQYKLYEENIVSYLEQRDFDSDYVLEYFKKNKSPVLHARFIGAMQQIGNQVLKIKLEDLFKKYEYKVAIENPFSHEYKLQKPGAPAYVSRFNLSINKAKSALAKLKMPKRSTKKFTKEDLNKIAVEDTYHSLTMEGYDVTRELIARLEEQNLDREDNDLRNKAAAKGFMKTLKLIGSLISQDYLFTENLSQGLYKELWSVSINAGILEDFEIYRKHMVSIRGSNSVPPNHEKILYLLDEFYKHANDFDNGFRQGIFLHFFYVWIHPHADGNGRISRFLMNLAFIKDKYRWLTIPSEDRKKYFAALERSQLEDDISYFAKYIESLY